jgi:hypothetical protein
MYRLLLRLSSFPRHSFKSPAFCFIAAFNVAKRPVTDPAGREDRAYMYLGYACHSLICMGQ